MSNLSTHQDKLAHNKSFYNSFITELSDPNKYADWGIVVMFYTALHIIESELAKNNKHTNNHKERKNFIHRNYNAIFRHYRKLELLSHKARYTQGFKFKKTDVVAAQDSLQAIEKFFV